MNGKKSGQSGTRPNYWVFILNALCDALFCAVDTAFGNNISQDVIAALGSFWTIHWLLIQIVLLGVYAFQVWRRHPYNCLCLSVAIATLVGIVVVFARVPISHIFQLSDVQYKMLQDCLFLDGLTLPMEAASRFMMSYITYTCHNKLMLGANAATYILLIGTDWLAVAMDWGCVGLVGSTQLTWFVYLIVVFVGCKFWQLRDKIRVGHMLYAVRCAKDTFIYRMVSRIANLFYGHFASTLGTAYVIHALCISVTDISEEFRNGIFNYQMVVIKEAKNKWAKCLEALRHYYMPGMLLMWVFSIGIMLFIHGKVPLSSAMPYLIIYVLPSFVYPVYDSLSAFLMTTGHTKPIAWRSLISCIWRIGVTALFVKLGFGLVGVAVIVFLDYFTAMIYFLIKGHKFKDRTEEAVQFD